MGIEANYVKTNRTKPLILVYYRGSSGAERYFFLDAESYSRHYSTMQKSTAARETDKALFSRMPRALQRLARQGRKELRNRDRAAYATMKQQAQQQ